MVINDVELKRLRRNLSSMTSLRNELIQKINGFCMTIPEMEKEYEYQQKSMNDDFLASFNFYDKGNQKKGEKYQQKGKRHQRHMNEAVRQLQKAYAIKQKTEKRYSVIHRKYIEIYMLFRARIPITRQYVIHKQPILRQACVPEDYWNNCEIKIGRDSAINVFFGGKGEPGGPGHAHHVISDYRLPAGYQRPINGRHGPHNFMPWASYHEPVNPKGEYPWVVPEFITSES